MLPDRVTLPGPPVTLRRRDPRYSSIRVRYAA